MYGANNRMGRRAMVRYAPSIVKLLQPVLEHLLFLVLVNEGIPFAEPVKLVDHPFEQLCRRKAISKDNAHRYTELAFGSHITSRTTKRLSNHEITGMRLTEAMLVWFASMSPLTRWFVGTYGDLRVRATWMEAGPQGMKLASWRSRMRRSDWWTCLD